MYKKTLKGVLSDFVKLLKNFQKRINLMDSNVNEIKYIKENLDMIINNTNELILNNLNE